MKELTDTQKQILASKLERKQKKKEKRQKNKGSKIAFGIVFLILIAIGISITFVSVDKEKPTGTKTQTQTGKPTQTSISYSKKEVYDFVINYPIYGEEAKELGYTIGSITDGLVGILRSQGQKVDVVEGNAEPIGEKGIWRVSYVVVADGKRDKVIYVVDMNKKTVEPDNQIARDLFYGE